MLKPLFRGAIVFASIVFPIAMAQAADDTLVKLKSPHSVSMTVDKLSAAVTNAGAKVFARVDHGKGGASVNMKIPDNELLIFGNPLLGTPLIKDAQTIGLDLPIRVSVFETEKGTMLAYRKPAALAAMHGISKEHPSIMKMTGALKKLTAKAIE